MKVLFSKSFIKSAEKLSGKIKESLRNAISEIEKANKVEEITDCKKLVGYNYVYRVRIGNYRAFFTFHIHIEGDSVLFQYLILRGEAYSKKNLQNLKEKDR